MKIAHFNLGIYLKGGMGTYIDSLCKLQVAAGNHIELFEISATQAPQDGIVPVRVKNETELFQRCQELSIDILHYHTGPKLFPPKDLATIYTVHEHSPHCISGGLFLKRSGKPCPRTYDPLGCLHGHVLERCGSIRPSAFKHNYNRMKLQMEILPGSQVICVGQFLKNAMLRAGYPPERIDVVPNFTDIDPDDRENTPAGPARFLFMGRLGKLKGVEWLLKAMPGVTSEVFLSIAGEGPEEQALKGLVQELGIEKRVEFLGWIDRDAKIDLIRASRAVVVPSIWHETFGLVAIEAGACARPVIVSDAGELPFIVDHGFNGLVVQAGNIAQLADAIEALSVDPKRASTMGRNNYERVKNRYNSRQHITAINAAYAKALVRRVEPSAMKAG